MNRNYVTVDQDLKEQARIRRLDESEAKNRTYANYGFDSDAVNSWGNTKSEPLKPDSPRLISDPIGLALSGGGIRSATFNLGVLQALHERGLLRGFDYLSTVSGGGYVGGFWSKWRGLQDCTEEETWKETEKDRRDAKLANRPEVPWPDEAVEVFPEPPDPSIRHLRNFSNFLTPRLSLISFETGRMFTAFVTGIVPTLLVTLGVMAAALLGWLSLSWLLTETPRLWATGAMAAILILAFFLFRKVWKSWGHDEELDTKGRELGEGKLIAWLFGIVAAATGLWWLLWPLIPLPAELRVAPVSDASSIHWLASVLPALTLLVPILILIIVRACMTHWITGFEPRRRRLTTLDMALSWSLFLTGAWVSIGTVWAGGQIVAGSGVTGIVSTVSVSGAGSGVFLWGRKFLRAQPNKPGGGRLLALLRSSIIQIVTYLTLLALLLLVGSLLSLIYGWAGLSGILWSAGGAAVLLFLPRTFRPQEVGFHGFYRQRLARAYLGAADQVFNPKMPEYVDCATLERSKDEIKLCDLPPGPPFHLICCAANDLAGDPIKTLHRGAESAVLSGLGIQVGKAWQPWASKDGTAATPDSGDKRKPIEAPFLGSAITASAAAFNSHMGAVSMKLGQAATFLLTALNLRLGMWIQSPIHNTQSSRLPLFYQELFGYSDLRRDMVHLSDGAHFENLALYELVRRRCRFIVVCDCGADPDYAFDDFANAVRRVRTDFGVEIDLDTDALRPDGDGKARQSVVSGTLMYEDGREAVLVLVKPTLTGTEPADVVQYARRNADFPQETTVDQFYDEEQWESYRKLGYHSMKTALDAIAGTVMENGDSNPQEAGADSMLASTGQHQADGNEREQMLAKARSSAAAAAAAKLRWSLAQGAFQWSTSAIRDPGELMTLERQWSTLEADLARDEQAAHLARQVLISERSLPQPDDPASPALAWQGGPMYVRRALVLMESVLRVCRLEEGEGPQTFGWKNRLGLWATSDVFVGWWGWLSPTTSRRLRRYLESNFHLPSIRKSKGWFEDIGSGGHGHALDQWRAQERRKKLVKLSANEKRDLEEVRKVFEDTTGGYDKTRYAYFLPISTRPRASESLMAATVEVAISPDRKHIVWRDDELFVPAGLWSTGFAESFLTSLCDALIPDESQESAPDQVTLEAVFTREPGAVTVALYLGAWFDIQGKWATRKLVNPSKATGPTPTPPRQKDDETDS